jgi:hypothetical protein
MHTKRTVDGPSGRLASEYLHQFRCSQRVLASEIALRELRRRESHHSRPEIARLHHR